MPVPANTEAQIIDTIREKNVLIQEQLDNMAEGYRNMISGGEAELASNQKIIDALMPLAEWQ